MTADTNKPDAPANPRLKEAWKLADAGSLTESESLFAKAIEGGNDPEALHAYGRFLTRTGRLTRAQEICEDLLELSGRAGRKWAAYAHGGMGIVLSRQGRRPDAERKLERALKIARDTNEPTLVGTLLGGLAYERLARGELSASEGSAAEAITMFRTLGDQIRLAQNLRIYGVILTTKGDHKQAELALTEAHKLTEQAGDDATYAPVLTAEGNLHLALGRLDEAERNYRDALRISDRLGDLEGRAVCRRNIGIVLDNRKDYRGARKEYEAAMNLYRELGALDSAQEMQSAIRRVKDLEATAAKG